VIASFGTRSQLSSWGDGARRKSLRFMAKPWALGLVWLVPLVGGAPQGPTLEEVLGRAEAYVGQYQARLASVVAEERYEQVEFARPKRVLFSDLLFVALANRGWVCFRDVMRVDGRPVTDRDERTRRIFLDAAQHGDVPQKIQEESSRFNIGPDRNINVPLLPLAFLQEPYRSRFRFSWDGKASIERMAVWIVTFVEKARPTVVQNGHPTDKADTDELSKGRFWIDPVSGRVLRTYHEVWSHGDQWRARLTVKYRFDPTLDLLVPAQMEEEYGSPGGFLSRSGFEGHATYSHYRQATVEVGPLIYK